jgi:hypothetical protein
MPLTQRRLPARLEKPAATAGVCGPRHNSFAMRADRVAIGCHNGGHCLAFSDALRWADGVIKPVNLRRRARTAELRSALPLWAAGKVLTHALCAPFWAGRSCAVN